MDLKLDRNCTCVRLSRLMILSLKYHVMLFDTMPSTVRSSILQPYCIRCTIHIFIWECQSLWPVYPNTSVFMTNHWASILLCCFLGKVQQCFQSIQVSCIENKWSKYCLYRSTLLHFLLILVQLAIISSIWNTFRWQACSSVCSIGRLACTTDISYLHDAPRWLDWVEEMKMVMSYGIHLSHLFAKLTPY